MSKFRWWKKLYTFLFDPPLGIVCVLIVVGWLVILFGY